MASLHGEGRRLEDKRKDKAQRAHTCLNFKKAHPTGEFAIVA